MEAKPYCYGAGMCDAIVSGMTLDQAIEKARTESLKGYVQHVNAGIDRFENGKPIITYYYVSDWYDSDKTVVSFENGRQL